MPLFIRRQRQELLALSAYLGALLAIRRKYTPIVHLLFKHARCRDKIFLNCLPLLCKRFFFSVSETFLKRSYFSRDNPQGSKINYIFALHKLSASHLLALIRKWGTTRAKENLFEHTTSVLHHRRFTDWVSRPDENKPNSYTVFPYYQKSKTMLRIFSNSRQLIHQDKVELAVTASQIETESEAWLAFSQPLK